MRLRAALILAILAVLALSGTACNDAGISEDAMGIQLKLQKKELDNGLTVIMVEDHAVPVISYQTWYRVGSVDEHPGVTGISHLFEHLMFKGTPKYGSKQFFLQLEAKGAEVNAFTTRDYTVYFQSFVPPLLDKVIDMESDRMQNLVLSDEVLDSERMVVQEERKLRTDNSPDGRMQEALWQLAYRLHPYRWPVIGYPEDLASITTDQLDEWYKAHYQPANAVLVIVGDFKPDATMDEIRKRYGPLAARKRPERKIPAEPEQIEERRLVMRDNTSSERFAQAYHVTSATEDDSYALDVLANILFEGTSSRAYRRLVDERDIAIGVSGSAFTPTYPGLFTISGVMKGGQPATAAEAELDKVIAEVQSDDDTKGVTDEEIKIAVRQLTVQLVDSVRTPYGLGHLIGTVQTVYGDPRRFQEDLGKYFKVTRADVRKMARKYLVPNHRSVVTLAPKPIETRTAQAAPATRAPRRSP